MVSHRVFFDALSIGRHPYQQNIFNAYTTVAETPKEMLMVKSYPEQ